jgi:hypothetical protein
MRHNLFIAYDLNSPGQNYDAVRDAIKALGKWHQFQYSLFYVSTPFSPEDTFTKVSSVMDTNDRLAVIDAERGVVSTWDRPPIAEINAIWSQHHIEG